MKYYFIHIPKTGGTSIRNSLAAVLPAEQLFFVSEFHEVNGLSQLDVASLRVVGGHIPYWMLLDRADCQGLRWERFAVVRHPVDRLLSLYNFLTSSEHPAHACFRGILFSEFLATYASGARPDLHMCYYFDRESRYAKSREVIVRENIAVYTIDQVERLRRVLSWKMGLVLPSRRDNVSRKLLRSSELKGLDLGFLENDMLLYEAALRGDFPKLRVAPLEIGRALVRLPCDLAVSAARRGAPWRIMGRA